MIGCAFLVILNVILYILGQVFLNTSEQSDTFKMNVSKNNVKNDSVLLKKEKIKVCFLDLFIFRKKWNINLLQ